MSSPNEAYILRLCDQVRETSFAMHRYLREGHLEKVYENGLCHRLQNVGITVARQCRVQGRDEDGTLLGDYIADMIVEQQLLIELKACDTINDAHTSQLLG